jgi:hypothetical protein
MSPGTWPGLPGLFSTYSGVVLVTVALLPLVVQAVWSLARRRMARGSTPTVAWRTSVAEVGIVYGTLPGVWLTMLPGSRAGEVTGAVSLVPLRDLPTMSTFQVVGNLLIFAALGLLAPLRFPALASVPRVTALAAVLSAGIEAAQYVLRLDRVSSVDDILLNAAGAGLASVVSLASLTSYRFAAQLRATR